MKEEDVSDNQVEVVEFILSFKTIDAFMKHTEGKLAVFGVQPVEGVPTFLSTFKIAPEWQEYINRNIDLFEETPPIIEFTEAGIQKRRKLKKDLRQYVRNGLLGKNNRRVREVFGENNVYHLLKTASTMNLADLVTIVYGKQVLDYCSILENLTQLFESHGRDE